MRICKVHKRRHRLQQQQQQQQTHPFVMTFSHMCDVFQDVPHYYLPHVEMSHTFKNNSNSISNQHVGMSTLPANARPTPTNN